MHQKRLGTTDLYFWNFSSDMGRLYHKCNRI